jgi:hypothetical protein
VAKGSGPRVRHRPRLDFAGAIFTRALSDISPDQHNEGEQRSDLPVLQFGATATLPFSLAIIAEFSAISGRSRDIPQPAVGRPLTKSEVPRFL